MRLAQRLLASEFFARAWIGGKYLIPEGLKPRLRPLFAPLLGNRNWTEIEIELLPLVVPRQRYAIDVGANIGDYTWALARLSAGVLAFEPDADLAAMLRARADPKVEVIAAALSDRDGSRILRIPIVDGAPAVSLATIRTDNLPKNFRECTVETTTLDNYRELDVGFIKIDVEGHEEEVLRGGERLLALRNPVILVEIENRHRPGAVASVRHYLESLGYVGFFVNRARTFEMEALTDAITDAARVSLPVDRRQMGYVNNFFFAPSAATATELRSAIDGHLASSH